jgi:cobalt-zinc-cadmium efflux system outer membrane protein
MPCPAPILPLGEPVDLVALWNLALASNPTLREAEASLEAARGRQVQAGKYPNPQVAYEEEALGTSKGPPGSIRISLSQEIITGKKRKLDVAIATRGVDAAGVALAGQRFTALTALRRAYVEFVGWHDTVVVNDEIVRSLEEAREVIRQQVETARLRPASDLLRIEALLEDAQVSQQRSRVNRAAAWRQLAAEVGVPDLPLPSRLRDLPASPPAWEGEAVVRRVLLRNTDIGQAAVGVERARLEVERARAEVIPNVTVAGGYNRNFAEQEAGALLSLQTRVPIWDRRQGQIREAQARWAQAQATLRAAVMRLSRDTAEAFARYAGSRRQLEALTGQVLPRLRAALKQIQEGYAKGAAQFTFADVLSARQALTDAALRAAQTRRDLWRAVADLQGLMQLDLGEELPAGEGPGTPCS